MKLALKTIRYVLTWPLFLGWLYPLLMLVCFAAKDPRLPGEGVLAATWRPWVTKFWKYSTTLARGMVLQPNASDRILAHEFVHVRQAEDLVLLGLVLGLVAVWVDPWLGLGLWVAAPLFQLPAFMGALLRGGHVYRDAEHERSAYAQNDGEEQSWLERHLSRPREW
jgi:hypothetical protein